MIKNIVKDTNFLSKKSIEASKDDLYITKDLIDTLMFHKSHCLGLASNMIGYLKRIIVVFNKESPLIMINPTFLKKEEAYFTSEGCLSLNGLRNTIRFNKIRVSYFDNNFHHHEDDFEGLVAETIEHEMDHLDGIII